MWTNFFSAVAGAAATLTGLIFVGVSISLAKILSISSLPDRALQSLMLLGSVLLTSLLSLVPGQPIRLLGVELLCIGLVAWPMALKLDLEMLRNADPAYRGKFRLNMLLTQLAVLPYLLAGALVICRGPKGIYWLVPGLLFSFVKAVLDAWVLLVEIHR
jgi:hypothetical protein